MTKQSDHPDQDALRDRVAELERALADARAQLASLQANAAAVEAGAAKLRTIIDTIPYPIFAKNNDLRYTVCNPAFERYLGRSAAELIGKTVYEIADREKADVYHAADLDLLQRGGTQTYEAKVRFHDGSDHDVIFHKAVLPDGRGGVDGMYGFIYDITELRQAEMERVKLEEQLQHTQKIQSIGQLAGGVAHDLNNLLTPILGFSALLLANTDPADPRFEHLCAVQHAAERARDLVRQLLAFGRRQVLELKPVDMGDLVSHFAEMLRRTIREEIGVELSLPPGPVPVRADVGQIEQVLTNLALNAQDAMPAGGVLRVVVSESLFDEQYAASHPGVTAGPHVVLAVSDTGCGMTASTVARIFEPFFTTKELGKGTGLGLSTSYGIVKQHGGHILVYSEPGLGSTFKVCLPKAGTLGVTANFGTVDEQHAPLGTETVLIAEDDAGVRALASGVLGALGYRVLVADTVERAVALVETAHEPLDLLLTDVVMPLANGRELFERLRQWLPGLKVVYMSGYDRNVIAHHGVLEDGVHFVQKPFTGPTLARKVREALEQGEP